MKSIYYLAAIAVLSMVGAPAVRAADCVKLTGWSSGDALIVETEEVTSAITVANLSKGPGSAGVSVDRPFCRVQGIIRPTADSYIRFEVWLPPAAAWNGKYQGVGNGAFLGAVPYFAMEKALRAGYAVAGTDNGHTSTGSDASWALGHPEKIIDYGWRAAHETALTAKAIISAFYGTAARWSYFVGCSKGGGQAMMEAQRFPTDYNGIIAGAPGLNQSGQIASYLWTTQTVAAPGRWLSKSQLESVNTAVLAACHGHDGYVDNPAECHFNAASLQCKRDEATGCLTAQQVETVRRFYSGPLDAHGKSIYPGEVPGSELMWSGGLIGPEDRPALGAAIYANLMGDLVDLLFGNSDWDFRALDVVQVRGLIRQRLGPAIEAVDPDLSSFKQAGGKLIMYQGWNDPTVRPEAAVQYFDSVVAALGAGNVDSFYRLFMAPGMYHCEGGPGPNNVGQHDSAPGRDPQHDIVVALEQWVENGRPVDQLIATRFRNDDPQQGIAAQHPWCAYPATARYTGHGDRNLAAGYVCSIARK